MVRWHDWVSRILANIAVGAYSHVSSYAIKGDTPFLSQVSHSHSLAPYFLSLRKLSKLLIENKFSREKIDTTIFIKIENNDMLLAQIYVDDIIFSATKKSLCKEFSKCIQGEFEMSMMREFNYFLGL